MRTSVRGRLLAGLLVLVALGLAGVDLVTWTSLRSFLLSRLNGQISSTIHPIEGQLDGEFDLEGVTADPAIIRRVVPPGVFAQIRTDHRVIVEISPTDSAGNPIDPSLPTPLPRSGRHRPRRQRQRQLPPGGVRHALLDGDDRRPPAGPRR